MAGLLVVLGTRPEAIKLWPVIEALRGAGATVRLCSTGQHRELLNQALTATGLEPDVELGLMVPGQSLSALMGRMLPALSRVIEHERPERVIVQGDTTTALTSAIAAHHLRVPVAHVEAGLRSGDPRQPWPEEFNRIAIGAIADLHFAPTERAAQALIAEGRPASSVIITGNTVIDALFAMRARIAAEPGLCASIRPVLDRARDRHLLLVTCHRRESMDHGLSEIAAGLRAIAARPDVRIALPLHPNPAVWATLRAALAGFENIDLLPALDYPSFVALLAVAHIVLTDSGGVQEEALALGKPLLILRERTERPEGVDAGGARLVGARAQRIVAETCRLLDHADRHAQLAHAPNPYGDGRAAERIAAVLVGAAKQGAVG